MGAFEDVLNEGLPEPEVHIYLPGKVGTVDKGGDAAQTAASPAGKPSDSQAAGAAPEPEPQLPEGSDPDDPDTAEDDAADAAAAAAAAREMFKPEPVPETTADGERADDDKPDDDTSEHAEPEATVNQAVMRPMFPKKGSALSFDGERAQLKHFPKVLIEMMRDVLVPHLGEPFVRELSQNSTVTAFAIAALGVEFEVDEKTTQAVAAFRANDPRTEVIEKRTALMLEQQSRSEGMLKALLGKVGEVIETASVLEVGQAYALAERTAQLDSATASALPEHLDVTQKRVIATRDNIRKRVKAQRQDEKIRAGRPIR